MFALPLDIADAGIYKIFTKIFLLNKLTDKAIRLPTMGTDIAIMIRKILLRFESLALKTNKILAINNIT